MSALSHIGILTGLVTPRGPVDDTISSTDTASTGEPPAPPDEPAPPHRLRLTAGILGRTWLWFVAGCLVITMLPMLFGWRPYVIQSGSMMPRIAVGDVILAAPEDDPEVLLGRVTVFESPDVPDKIISHRVVTLDGELLVTKGDANPTMDTTPITLDDVRGLGRLLVRWVGLPLIWIQTQQWLYLGLFLTSLALSAVAVTVDHDEEDDA